MEDVTLRGTDLTRANLVGVRHLDQARNLDEVESWRGVRIERKWVERLKLDAEKLGLVVVDDLPEKPDLESGPDLPDAADLELEDDLPDDDDR